MMRRFLSTSSVACDGQGSKWASAPISREIGAACCPGPIITELRQFVAAGYSTFETLRTATAVGAEILDMSDKLDTPEPGILADVSIMRGAPEKGLDDLANVDSVIVDGVIAIQHGEVRITRHVPLTEPFTPQECTP